MKKLTLAIIALFVAGGLVFAVSKKTPEQQPAPAAQEQVAAAVETAEQAVTETAESVADTAETAASAVTETVESTATATGEAATAAVEGATETAEDVATGITAEATEATKAVTETAAAVAEKTESLLAAPAAMQQDVAKMMEDRVLGNPDAPVTIIEYASMTCGHCAHFANTVLPDVKARLIDTGKAKLVYRDFPLDNLAVKAAMLARCAPADKYFDFVEVIFHNQERWVRAEKPLESLSQLGALAGMDQATMDACFSNTELENTILTRMQDAQTRYNVQQTPTFVFNNGRDQFSGAQNVEKFEATVNALSKGQ